MLAKSVISASKSVMLKNALPAIQVAYFSRSLGQVKWFDTKKGFGFIAASTGEDLFVHQSAIKSDGFRALTQGATVEFEVAPEPNKDGKKYAVAVTAPGGGPIIPPPPRKSFNPRRPSPNRSRSPRNENHGSPSDN